MNHRSRLWLAGLARLALLAFSVLLVLGFAEVWARLSWHEPPAPAALPPEQAAGLPELWTLPELARPNLHAQHQGVVYRTNSHQLRGPEYDEQAPVGTLRIGVTGDSVTVGWGVNEDETYSAGLGRRLREARTDHDWQVINTGLAGLNANQAVRRLRRMDEIYDFDLVVYGFTRNDIENGHYEKTSAAGADSRRFERARSADASASFLWRRVWPRLHSLIRRLHPSEPSIVEETLHNYFENEAAWQEFSEALDDLQALSVDRGRCGVVLIHTQLAELGLLHPYQPVYDKVAAAAEARGLLAVPSFGAFRGRFEQDLWVGPYDPHPNAKGHAIFADVLTEAVLGLPAACWPVMR